MQVYQIFTAKCAECHGGHRKKPKGSFGFVLDLERLGNDEYYVTKGDPEDSELYRLLITDSEDELMPPVDGDVAAMTEAEIQAVHDWIKMGAGIGVAAPAQSAPVESDTKQVEVEDNESGGLLAFIGHMHPLLVHFPIALLLVAGLCEVLSCFRSRESFRFAVTVCIVIATVSAIFSSMTGWINAGVEGFADATVFTHRWSGIVLSVLCVGLIALDVMRRKEVGALSHKLFCVLLFICVFLVALVGHTGGELVYGEGYFF